MLRHLHRQRLDVDLATHLRQNAALAHSRRVLSAHQLHGDRRLDRLVEPHLLQVDVDQAAAQRILLILLEDRRMRGLLPGEHDVENRVEAAGAAERAAQLALRDTDRVRLRAPVEDARDETLLAQAPGLPRTDAVALPDFQLDPLSRHFGGGV